MGYSKAEQETVLTFNNDTGEWSVYSTVPKHIRKLLSINNELLIIEKENDRPLAIQGYLTEKQVSLKKQRILSEEQKEELRLRGKALKRNWAFVFKVISAETKRKTNRM